MTLGGVVLAVAGMIGEGPPDATGTRKNQADTSAAGAWIRAM